MISTFSFLSRKLWLVFSGSLKKIWFLKLGIGHWKLFNWNLNFWDLRFWIEIWYFEKLKLGILKICNLKFWTWNLKFEIFTTWNFGDFECKNWAFRTWNFKLGNENFELKIWDLGFEKNLKFEPEVLSLISSKRFVIPFLFFFFFFFENLFFSFHDVIFLGVKKKRKWKEKKNEFFFGLTEST